MDIVTQAKLTGLLSIVFVIALKTYGAYKMKQIMDKREGKNERGFSPLYIITAVFGTITAASIYTPTINTTDFFDIFYGAFVYAMSYTLQFDFMATFAPKKKD